MPASSVSISIIYSFWSIWCDCVSSHLSWVGRGMGESIKTGIQVSGFYWNVKLKSNIVLKPSMLPWQPRGRLNIKMYSYQYSNSHYKDKTVSRPSYLCIGIPIHGKTIFVLRRIPAYLGILTPMLQTCEQISVWRKCQQLFISSRFSLFESLQTLATMTKNKRWLPLLYSLST